LPTSRALETTQCFWPANRWRGIGGSNVSIDENTIVVPVPDTSKCGRRNGLSTRRSGEGLIRNRYTGRTFIKAPACGE
jgi:hypothetical protein